MTPPKTPIAVVPDAIVDPAAYREAMSLVASQVYILATDGPAGRSGLTATAVTSISDHPPMLLACVNQSQSSTTAFLTNTMFSVNVLAASDQTLADIFAGRTGLSPAERFAHGAWTGLREGRKGMQGPPRLASALACFVCRLQEARPMATHVMLVGTVEAVYSGAGDENLLYCRRRYAQVQLPHAK